MSFFKRLLGIPEPETTPPETYETPWEAVQAFIHDPEWQVEILEERRDWVKIQFNGVVGELLDDPDDEWLHVRFRHPFTMEEQGSELAMYAGWAESCTRYSLFRWDIDVEAQEHFGYAFALFHYQYNQVECIRAAFNSARLLTVGKNQITVRSPYNIYTNDSKEPTVALALWRWLSSPLAPSGTRYKRGTYREEWYDMGSAIASVMQEDWSYYTRISFTASDFMPYMKRDDETRLMLYKMHLGIQRWYPRIRNFVLMTGQEDYTGIHETSVAILVSSGSNADPIFERIFKEFYGNVMDYTEWFNFDFNEQTDPWFDHTRKKKQKGYKRKFPARGMTSV